MAVSERDRHELYRRLEGVIGKEPADTMMALLPAVGWADVATKEDLRNLEERLTLRMENTERRILQEVHQQIASLSKTMAISIVVAIATVAGLAFGAAQLV